MSWASLPTELTNPNDDDLINYMEEDYGKAVTV
jgi:hypothetical protein